MKPELVQNQIWKSKPSLFMQVFELLNCWSITVLLSKKELIQADSFAMFYFSLWSDVPGIILGHQTDGFQVLKCFTPSPFMFCFGLLLTETTWPTGARMKLTEINPSGKSLTTNHQLYESWTHFKLENFNQHQSDLLSLEPKAVNWSHFQNNTYISKLLMYQDIFGAIRCVVSQFSPEPLIFVSCFGVNNGSNSSNWSKHKAKACNQSDWSSLEPKPPLYGQL